MIRTPGPGRPGTYPKVCVVGSGSSPIGKACSDGDPCSSLDFRFLICKMRAVILLLAQLLRNTSCRVHQIL